MTNSIQPFLEVFFKHHYYNDGRIRDLRVTPDSSTHQILNQLGLFFKQNGDSFLLGYSSKTTDFFSNNSEKIMLTFEIENTNPYFFNITDLPFFSPAEKLLYFDNLNKKVNFSDAVSENNIVPLGFPSDEIKSGNPDDKHLIINELGKEIASFKTSETEEINATKVKLRAAAPNLFTLKTEEKNTSFYIPSSSRPILGMLHLYIDKTMLGGQKLDYEIQVNNRKTYWRYYFISDQLGENPAISISHLNKSIAFSSPQLMTLPTGQKAWQVVSESPVALEERPPHNFKGTFKFKSNPTKEVSLNLPNANSDRISPDKKAETQKMYSDMYVYL